jgi:hypothetical protein
LEDRVCKEQEVQPELLVPKEFKGRRAARGRREHRAQLALKEP